MRLFGKFALATAMATATVTVAALPVAANAAKEKQQAQPSAAFVEQYNNTAASLNAADIATAKASFQAMAANMQNEQERYLAGKLAIEIAKRSEPRDQALLQQGAGYILASTATPAEERGPIAVEAALAAYNQRDYNGALSYVQQARQANVTSPELQLVSSLSELALGRQSGFDGMRATVTAATANGEAVPEQWYALPAKYALDWNKAGLDAAAQAKIDEELAYWTRAQLQAYPTGANWRTALGAYTNTLDSASDDLLEDIYRLRAYTGSLIQADDFSKYLSSITRAGQVLNPNEAMRWLQQGIDRSYISRSDSFVAQGLASAATGKAADERDGPKLEQQAIASGNPKALNSAADRALDQGRYARAIELYDLAVGKGFNADTAALRKGVANYELGNMAAARADFQAVNGASASGLASYWLMFLDQKGTTVGF